MGIEGRDWYREESRKARSRLLSRREVAVVVVVLGALVLVLSPPVRGWLGYELPFGLEDHIGDDSTPGALRSEDEEVQLYAPDDPWQAWLAEEATCPGGEDGSAPPAVQARVMLCLVNFARAREGLRPLAPSPLLRRSATAKAGSIARCQEFAHRACGRPVAQAARRLGYDGAFGENLYLAEGPITVPRVALDRWLNSDGHRRNLFRREWRTLGVGLRGGVDIDDVSGGVVWVQHFGT